MNALPAFSIIIPTHNRIPALVKCLRGIAALDYPRTHIQVIVVNDGGAEIPKSLVTAWKKELDLVVLKQENHGAAAARNLGVRHAVNEWLAFTDDDCMPAADWLRCFADASVNAPDAMLGGETRNGLPENIYATASQCLISFLLEYYHCGAGKRTQFSFFPSNNLAISRRVFEQVGGFDVALRFSEDRDFCARVLLAGYTLCYISQAHVDHFRTLNFKSFWRQHHVYGNGAYVYQQNRASVGANVMRPEPFRFYARMMMYPYQHVPHAAARVMALIALAQLANAFGFFQESFRAHRVPDSLSAQKSL